MPSSFGITPILNWSRREARIDQSFLREVVGEFFATFLFSLFAVGGTCNVVSLAGSFSIASSTPSVFPVAFGYFISTLIFGGVSGAHVNPAVSIGMAIAGKLSWVQLQAFVLVQFAAGYLGSLLAFGMFKDLIDNVVVSPNYPRIKLKDIPGSERLFNASPGAISIGAGFLNEIILTMIFMMAFLAIKDGWNSRAPRYVQGILLGLVVAGFGLAFGETTAVAINPIRDICPRLAGLTCGWSTNAMMRGIYKGNQWWVVGLIAPFLGAILGAFMYVFVVGAQLRYSNEDSGEVVTIQASPTDNGTTTTAHRQEDNEWKATVFIPKLRDDRARTPYAKVQFQH